MKIYLIWLVGVIVWNYGVPQATPLQDVLDRYSSYLF